MKKILFIFSVLLLSISAFSQQLPLYSQYSVIGYLYNPALAGTDENINISLLHRNQWKGIPGAPTTSLFTLDGPVAAKNIGMAGTVFQDVTDIIQRVGAYASYSYKLKINEDQKVLLGASLGFVQQRIDLTKAIIKDDNDPMLMYRTNLRSNIVDATFGAIYNWKALEVGVSVPQLLGNKVEFVNTNASSYFYMARHILFSAKYSFDINKEQEMKIYPLILMRYVKGSPVQYDINAVFDWKKYGWASLTYRSNYAIGVNIGFRVSNTLRAGYAYDYSINSLKTYAAGSHEFFLGYTFGRRATEEIASDSKTSSQKDSIIEKLAQSDKKRQQEIEELKNNMEKLKLQHDSINKLIKDFPGMQIAKAAEFKKEDGTSIEKGFYVVIGAFKSVSNAENARTAVLSKYPETTLLFNSNRGFHYVYVMKTNSPETAEEVLKAIQDKYNDAWIFDME
ncbi:MAG: PorP/SprF family type IX secretion system membrane protein [Bacteroidota bacterium]|jgi:type IX secretion system PorP/SprF family membrane protein